MTLTRLAGALLLAAAPTGALQAQVSNGSNGYYDVAVRSSGEYTSRTGPLHPNPGLDVFYAGTVLNPGTTWNSVRSYDSNREWVLGATGRTATTGFTCAALLISGTAINTPITDAGGATTGTRLEWRVNDPQDQLTIVQEVNAEGTTYENSVVRVTLCITNNGTTTASVGIRYQWDWQIAGQDGPFIGIRPPYPPNEPFLATETDFASPSFDFYDVSSTQNPTVQPGPYRVGGTVNAPAQSMGPTAPELVQYASWPGAQSRCFTYATTGQTVGGLGRDSCVTYYWGATPVTSILLGPGEQYCVSQYVFVFTDTPPPLCAVDAVCAEGFGCDVTSVRLDGSLTWSADCAGPLEYRFFDPLGNLVRDWDVSPLFDATMTGDHVMDARCSTDPSCMDSTLVAARMEWRPVLGVVTAGDLASCNLGLKVTWDPARFEDPGFGGYYDVYRSEISCADALTRPPIATDVRGTTINDAATVSGQTYHYAIVAENATFASVCTPVGSRGGATATACASPIVDVSDPSPPDYLCWPLRVRHVGQAVTLDWSLGRALEPGEHYHVLKADTAANRAFALVNGEGDLATTWTETDTATRLHFFDVRVANACEASSPDDEPPGLDPPPGVPCP